MQVVFGKHHPKKYLDYAALADVNGFDALWVGDHFHPWSHTGFSGGFAWSWIASAAERTKRIKIGTSVTPPILRYNPALVAQAFATMGSMYEGRIFLGLGTGEAMNEIPIGTGWPSTRERVERFEEALRIIRLLWEGEFVTFQGRFFSLHGANLYTKPSTPIPIIVACHGPKVARLAGKYGDGFITSPLVADYFGEVLRPAFIEGATEAGKDPNSLQRVMNIITSFDEDYDVALSSASRFAATLKASSFTEPISDPREFERISATVDKKEMLKSWIVASDLEEPIKKIQEYLRMGFNAVDLVSLSPDDSKFITTFGKEVLPYIRENYRPE